MQRNDLLGEIYAAARVETRLTMQIGSRLAPIARARLHLIRRRLDRLIADARALGIYDRALVAECDAQEDERSCADAGGLQ